MTEEAPKLRFTMIPPRIEFKSHPIRLGIRRVTAHHWWISRAGEEVGELEYKDGKWIARSGEMDEVADKGRVLCYTGYQFPYPSFRTAALSLTRLHRVTECTNGVADRGDARVLRTFVGGHSFVILLGQEGESLYQKFSTGPDMSDELQAILRKVNVRVQNWKRENP